jgi:3-isopropylmalate/(R)-2-methylmalate dehydratase small subunit
MNVLKHRVLAKYGDNISTDDMTSGKYLTSNKPEDLGKICMYDIDPEFPAKMAPGGILIGGMNFGCGSSRETAPIALKACNVKVIVAEEYARIFYRNCINVGIPVIECQGIYGKADLGDEMEIELDTGVIKNLTKGETCKGSPVPAFLMDKIEAGGLLEVLKKRLGNK